MGSSKSTLKQSSALSPVSKSAPNIAKTSTSSNKYQQNRKKSAPSYPKPNDRKQSVNLTTRRSSTSGRSSLTSENEKKKPILTGPQRQIVKYCMDNAKEDLGERILRRIVEKSLDFRFYLEALNRTDRFELGESIKKFIHSTVLSINDSDNIQHLAEEFGSKFVAHRSFGFKPDFFAVTANAVTTECVFLDAAVHQATETLTAWSVLTSFCFSSVRDGYYGELRRQRRLSNSALRFKLSVDQSSTENVNPSHQDVQNTRRSTSPPNFSSSDDDRNVINFYNPTNEEEYDEENDNKIGSDTDQNRYLSPNMVY
ncbi:Globin-like domain and Globin, structural domain-containing protein [Strongyloides ratti]|uniref:Globin-like domain and Globin, structural domain-containing protein n=1 Tax=Strongyloides ratti TaxID=34506 RepID=A0A090LBS2_STRRB|nr:Globin-like domain and Globin, structural domain-containing protein [Strongyloides ratti]CEF64995.1 Globin-like domain and Globin, structural domain-containing protein [Strongyloides ratti]